MSNMTLLSIEKTIQESSNNLGTILMESGKKQKLIQELLEENNKLLEKLIKTIENKGRRK